MKAVEGLICSSYPFQSQEKDGVVIMDGKGDGVYAWIAANYLLGTIKASTPPDTPTYAVLDLGGVSMQVVFEPVFVSSDMQPEEGEHKYVLQWRLWCGTHRDGIGVLGRSPSQKTSPTHGVPFEGAFWSSQASMWRLELVLTVHHG